MTMRELLRVRKDAAIIADLRNPDLLHVEIAVRNRVGINRINRLAVANGLTRKRGKRPPTKLT